MAEEDLIFGKNRHMFGGIEPSNMRKFLATSMYDFKNKRPTVTVTATLPLDTIVENQTLCTVAGAVIRRKTTGYPVDEFDGEIVADITCDTKILDIDVAVGSTYYYAAFPYSDLGVFNRNLSNRTSIVARDDTYIFGFDLDTTDPDPSTRVTYPSDTDNAEYSPAKMNYAGMAFDYGDWPSEAGLMFMPRPCMLNNDGTVYEYLNPNDYTKNMDGGTSKAHDTSFNGNAMMEWPKIYYKRGTKVVGSDTYYTFRCSNVKVDDDWDCWCNYDINNNVIDHFYTAIYPGSVIDDKLRSIGGQKTEVYRVGDLSAEYHTNLAKKNGSDWLIDTFADHLLIYDLLIMLGKTTNLADSFGNSSSQGANSHSYTSGTMDTFGLFYGGTDVNTFPVKAFGIEGIWGCVRRWLIGLVIKYVGPKYEANYFGKITRGTHDGTTATDYAVDTSTSSYAGYLNLGFAVTNYNVGINGYWRYNTFGTFSSGAICSRLPGVSASSGASTTYDCEYSSYSKVGVSSADAIAYDAFSGFMSLSNDGNNYVSASLSCKPRLT